MKERNRIDEIRSELYRANYTNAPDWFQHGATLITLRRTANRLRKLYEHSCNGCTRDKYQFESWSEYDKARELQMIKNDKAIERAEKRIKDLCDEIGMKFYIQSDPRGCALYLGTDSDTSYNTQGVAIY